MSEDLRLERARELYERAVFNGESEVLPQAEQDLDGVAADLALARGRILHARFLEERQEDPREVDLFEQAVAMYQRLGDIRGEGEATFWIGLVHQVVRGDHESALPFLDRAYELAVSADDPLTLSYAARHLGFAHAEAGRAGLARERLEESLRLRREIGFQPGVAAALLALAELAASDGRPDQASALLDEAETTATACGARGISRWIGAARTELDQCPETQAGL